jgi:Tfp pilus assembly protein PilX
MSHPSFSIQAVHRQRGVAIIVALMVLVAMSLAAVAMMRSVDTAALIAGNLAFRQGATLGGDLGLEEARTTLLALPDLTNSSATHGYYASTPDSNSIDLTGNRLTNKSFWVRWPGTDGAGQTPRCLATDATTGNQVCYIVHRLCDAEGALDVDTCYTYSQAPFGPEESGRTAHEKYGPQPPGGPWQEQAYYRITIRTQGPRNNISFLQAFVVI